MLEMKDGKKILTTPISAEDLKDIHAGDIVYLNGSMTTCRDVAHRRVVEYGRKLPVDVKDKAILHAGPIIRPLGDDKFEMVSVGPTTSMRMEKFEKEFVEQTGVRVIVGKGGMGPNTEYACKNFGAIHCVFPAGNAVVAATEVQEIVDANWRELGMPEHLITRHPFPGPGLAVRILGDITPEKVRILQDADDIFIQGLRDWGLYDKVWQAGVILLPVQSVGVMGDERTYERAVALRAVTSTDAMTADWAHLPYEFMGKVSNDIINKVKGVNRVTYDISSKPPATIEWE